jgi:hypothetical protein
MGFDVVLIAVIVGGIALSVAYVRAEYLSWRERGATQRRREAAQGQLHAESFSDQRDALLPSVMKLQGFGTSEAANPDESDYAAARRASGLGNSPPTYSLAERRKRIRKRATY